MMNATHPSRDAAEESGAGLDRLWTAEPRGLQSFQALLKSAGPGSSACTLAQSKALIGLAMAVAQRCDCRIDRQTRGAVSSRADRVQIIGVIRRAIHMADGPALAYGAHALASFDRLSAQWRGAAPQSETKPLTHAAPQAAPPREIFSAMTASRQRKAR